MNKILVYIYKRFFKKMNKLFLLFLCLIISKTSAQLLNDNYEVSFDSFTYHGACQDNMDLLEWNGVILCVPSNINNGCSGSSKLSGCLTLDRDGNDCLPHLAAKKFLFTNSFIIYICAANFCEEPYDGNIEWQNIKVSAGCPHPTSNQCDYPGEQFTSGISMCECPSPTSVNIPSTCEVNLEQGTCEEVAFMVDDTDNKGHHDIFCTSPKDECNLVNSEVPPHCEVTLPYNCQYKPDFFYVYGADTSQESARCCPNPYSYKNDKGELTIDHIPGGCPAPVDENNDLLTNMDDRQPCEERGKTAFNKGITICCPPSDSKYIPGGCPVGQYGTCRHGRNDDGNTCLTPYDDPSSRPISSATISSATTSAQLIEANIPLTTLEAAYRAKNGVVLDSSTSVDQLGVVSADKLKAAYQNKDGTCS